MAEGPPPGITLQAVYERRREVERVHLGNDYRIHFAEPRALDEREQVRALCTHEPAPGFAVARLRAVDCRRCLNALANWCENAKERAGPEAGP